MLPPRQILVVGDIGGHGTYHVGDEAMLQANLDLLDRLLPGAGVTLVSGDPSYSTRIYGVPAVAGLGFLGTPAHRAQELDRMDGWVGQAMAGEVGTLPPALRAVQGSDLLLISGGGNLSSSWPHLVLERLALVRMARAHQIPVLIWGQTLGPAIDDADAPLVHELLAGACWVGLREAFSVALAIDWGLPPSQLDYQFDDAMFLPGAPGPAAARAWVDHPSPGPRIGLTMHPLSAGTDTALVDALAAQLDAVVSRHHARFAFISHERHMRGGHDNGDRMFGEHLLARMQHGASMEVFDVMPAAETAWFTRQMDAVVSTRYHPLVFGLSGAVPCLGLPTGPYTLAKLQGALLHADLTEHLLPLDIGTAPQLADRVAGLLAQADTLRARLRQQQARWRTLAQEREQRLARFLAHIGDGPVTPPADGGRVLQDLARALMLRTRGDEANGWITRDMARQLAHWRNTAEQASAYAHSLETGGRIRRWLGF